MTQVSVLVRCQLPGNVYAEPKNAVFVNHRVNLTNFTQVIDPDKQFIFIVANFFNVPQKIRKHMVLGYATRISSLLIPVDSPMVAHVSESLGYVPTGEADIGDKAPPIPVFLRHPPSLSH